MTANHGADTPIFDQLNTEFRERLGHAFTVRRDETMTPVFEAENILPNLATFETSFPWEWLENRFTHPRVFVVGIGYVSSHPASQEEVLDELDPVDDEDELDRPALFAERKPLLYPSIYNTEARAFHEGPFSAQVIAEVAEASELDQEQGTDWE